MRDIQLALIGLGIVFVVSALILVWIVHRSDGSWRKIRAGVFVEKQERDDEDD